MWILWIAHVSELSKAFFLWSFSRAVLEPFVMGAGEAGQREGFSMGEHTNTHKYDMRWHTGRHGMTWIPTTHWPRSWKDVKHCNAFWCLKWYVAQRFLWFVWGVVSIELTPSLTVPPNGSLVIRAPPGFILPAEPCEGGPHSVVKGDTPEGSWQKSAKTIWKDTRTWEKANSLNSVVFFGRISIPENELDR